MEQRDREPGAVAAVQEEPFDYIIIGGGTAGLTVAARLTEDAAVRVLVLEAGSDKTSNPALSTPGLVGASYKNPDFSWPFMSVPQKALGDRVIHQPRGKVLGGSSSTNFMMTLFPTRENIDNWAELGNSGWSYDELAPYYQKFVTVHVPSQPTGELVKLDYHDETQIGTGPVQVSYGEAYPPLNAAWVETLNNLAFKVTSDPRVGKAIGVFQNPASIDPATNARSSSATAYYAPIASERKNLILWSETIVQKVVTESTDGHVHATGVQIVKGDGSVKTISAKREVILAAGALQTPQILELSGIGDPQILEKLGIPVVLDNPNVGENLQDHALICQSFPIIDTMRTGDAMRDPSVIKALMTQYATTKKGPLGQSSLSSAYVPLVDQSGPMTTEAKQDMIAAYCKPSPGTTPGRALDSSVLCKTLLRPDSPTIQYILFPATANVAPAGTLPTDPLPPPSLNNCFTIMSVLGNPFSRGSVHITSTDVGVLPTYDPKFLSEPIDTEILARSVQFVERIVEAEPLRSMIKADAPRIPDVVVDDLDKARAVVRDRLISNFHVAGTCAMLPREHGGVVGADLLIHGTSNLRVVDASMIPLIPLGNIQSTVYAVAERAADMIKAKWKAGP